MVNYQLYPSDVNITSSLCTLVYCGTELHRKNKTIQNEAQLEELDNWFLHFRVEIMLSSYQKKKDDNSDIEIVILALRFQKHGQVSVQVFVYHVQISQAIVSKRQDSSSSSQRERERGSKFRKGFHHNHTKHWSSTNPPTFYKPDLCLKHPYLVAVS